MIGFVRVLVGIVDRMYGAGGASLVLASSVFGALFWLLAGRGVRARGARMFGSTNMLAETGWYSGVVSFSMGWGVEG